MQQQAPLLPDPHSMVARLRLALPAFRHINWVQSTSSTNADLMGKARQQALLYARQATPVKFLATESASSHPRPWLLGTHHQTQGRGRSGRTWQNRAGANLMFSCAYDVFLPARQLPALSPLAGVAACEALRRHIRPAHQHLLTMKWPNDIQWKHAKLAGILIDVSRADTASTPDHHLIIIGIGLNLDDARTLSQSLKRQVADWHEITATDPQAASASMTDLVASIALAWYDILNEITCSGFEFLPARYQQVDGLAGQAVDILDKQQIIHSGLATGVNQHGQLIVHTGSSHIAISAGEVSLRPATNQSAH